MLDHESIAALTQEYGGDWGTNHSRRLLHLTDVIGEGLEYDSEVVWLAAYLHDWGGYSAWAVGGVDHAVRSKEVIGAFLRENSYDEETIARVLECIEYHHGGNPNPSLESSLVTDADALDLLGVVGTLRIFSMLPRDLRGAWNAVRMWREKNMAIIRLDKSRRIAEERIQESDRLLSQFTEETFGCF